MKLIVQLLAIAVPAAFVLVGCDQNTPSNPTGIQSTNSSMGETNNMPDVFTNLPSTNSLPNLDTNTPAGTNQ